MQVIPCGPPCVPYVANDLPGLHLLACGDADGLAVGVEGLQAAAVVELDVVAIPLGSDCWPQPADSRMIIHSHRHGMRQQICVYARQGFGASPKCASGRPDAMLAKHTPQRHS